MARDVIKLILYFEIERKYAIRIRSIFINHGSKFGHGHFLHLLFLFMRIVSFDKNIIMYIIKIVILWEVAVCP